MHQLWRNILCLQCSLNAMPACILSRLLADGGEEFFDRRSNVLPTMLQVAIFSRGYATPSDSGTHYSVWREKDRVWDGRPNLLFKPYLLNLLVPRQYRGEGKGRDLSCLFHYHLYSTYQLIMHKPN
jgi:hypothetical protein